MIVQDVIDAIRKNGIDKIKNYYFEHFALGGINTYDVENGTKNDITGGCAFGQAAMNLGVDADTLDSACGFPFKENDQWLNSKIRHLNDDTDMTLAEIADWLEINLNESQKKRVIDV